MTQPPPLSLFVKLGYWDVYRLNVILTASALRKVLYIWGFVALFWLSLSVLLLVRPSPTQDWAVMLENARPLEWAIALPFIFVFVLPLLTAQRVLGDDLVRRGVNYQFSDAGVHIETSISKSDLSWSAIRRVRESSSEFLVFTSPRNAFSLPKKCFESGQGVAILRELFRTHVEKSDLRPD
jgi:YcxB-like protein